MFLLIIWDINFVSKLVYSLKYFQPYIYIYIDTHTKLKAKFKKVKLEKE